MQRCLERIEHNFWQRTMHSDAGFLRVQKNLSTDDPSLIGSHCITDSKARITQSKTKAFSRLAFRNPARTAYFVSSVAKILIISFCVNGMVGRSVTFGARKCRPGLWAIHSRRWQKPSQARRRSSFFTLVRGPSFHVARNSPSRSTSSCFK